jgi:hypothetical protein
MSHSDLAIEPQIKETSKPTDRRVRNGGESETF